MKSRCMFILILFKEYCFRKHVMSHKEMVLGIVFKQNATTTDNVPRGNR
jgi:hypothetical protein